MTWNEIVQKSKKVGISPVFILREEMQKASLASLSRIGAFNYIVFQGGTALRHFYNSPRFSEDLDFVLMEGKVFDLASKSAEMDSYLSSEFHYLHGNIRVHIQKDTDEIQRLAIRTTSKDPSIKLVINMELVPVPSYLNSPKILPYPPLNPVVRIEDAEEILADKIIAIALRKYLKGRDIWDIFYLKTQLNASTSQALVKKKARDYGVEDPLERIKDGRERLLERGFGALDREMKRFLPASTYDQLENGFDGIVKTVAQEIHKYTESRGEPE